MAAREWIVPVVLGLVAGGLTYAFVPDDLGLPHDLGVAEGRPGGPYVLMPAPGSAGHASVLLRFTDAPPHGLGGVLTLDRATVRDGNLSIAWWWYLCQDGTRWCEIETPHVPRVHALPDGPALAHARIGDGDLMADITFFAFTSSGHILATNAPRDVYAPYDLHGEFSPFSQTTWYFGEGEAPPGASKVPFHRDVVRDALAGTPVGGVQSMVLVDHEYEWLLGPVWITARVEAVHPPGGSGP